MKNQFTKQLQNLIQASGKTQNTICKDMVISRQQLSKWKTGYIEPNIDNLIMLANYFDVSIDELVGLSDVSDQNARQHSEKLPAKVSGRTIEFTDDFAELFNDESFINTAKLYKAIPPHMRGLALGYIVGLLQSNHIDTKSILGY